MGPEPPPLDLLGDRGAYRFRRFADYLGELDARPPAVNAAALVGHSTLRVGAVADLIADTTNRYMGVSYAAPALARLEANVLAWFAEILDYPREARGILTSGGSLANWTAAVPARRGRYRNLLGFRHTVEFRKAPGTQPWCSGPVREADLQLR